MDEALEQKNGMARWHGGLLIVIRAVAFGAFCVIGILFFISAGFSTGHSAALNYSWTLHYLETFNAGAMFPRLLPGAMAGLGAHDFFFYGPLPYWVTAALVSPICVSCEISTKIVVSATLFWVLSGITCYLFVRRYFERGAALLGAIGYTVLPYHLFIDWFERQALGEFAAYVFLPLIAVGLDAIRCGRRGKFWLAIGVAGMALSHLPTTLLAAHVFALIVIVFTIDSLIRKRPIEKFLIEGTAWGIIGGLLASFYWVPAIVLAEHVARDLLYTEHYLAARWLLQFSVNQTSPWFGATVLLSCLAVVPVVALASVYSERDMRYWILPPTVLALVLNTEIAAVLWDHWIIKMVQFPWRLMVFVDFAAALSIATLAAGFKRIPLPALVVSLVLALFPMAAVVYGSAHRLAFPFDVDGPHGTAMEYLSIEFVRAMESRLGLRAGESLPRPDIYAEARRVFDEVSEANVDRLSLEVGYREVRIVPREEVEEILIPVQYWVFWEATMSDGTDLEVTANDALGVISIAAPDHGFQGQEISLYLPSHWSERLGLWMSMCALFLGFLAMRLGSLKSDRGTHQSTRLGTFDAVMPSSRSLSSQKSDEQ